MGNTIFYKVKEQTTNIPGILYNFPRIAPRIKKKNIIINTYYHNRKIMKTSPNFKWHAQSF